MKIFTVLKRTITTLHSFIKAHAYTLMIISIIIYSLFYIQQNRWSGWDKQQWKKVIDSDGIGYYEYLRAAVIYNDFSYSYIFDGNDRVSPELAELYLYKNGEKRANKYYAGTALLLLPFFSIAHLLSILLGYELNGYSQIYQYFVSIATLFYLLLTFYYLKKLMNEYKIPPFISAFILALLYLGTNLFFYTTMAPAYSHLYSLFSISMFLYYSKKTCTRFSHKSLILASVAFGLAVLIRPTNGIILLALPFLAGNGNILRDTILKYFRSWKHVVFSIAIIISIVFIQLILYKIQTDKYIIWSYKGHSFDLLDPHLFAMLFGFRKGLFIYIPISFLAFLSVFYLIRKQFYEFITLLSAIMIILYFFSTWCGWAGGASYGPRMLIEFYPLLFLPLGIFTSQACKRILPIVVFIILSGIFISFNLIQTNQYNNYIIHHGSMNKERYCKVFLKTASRYKGIFYTPVFDPGKVQQSFTQSFNFDDDSTYCFFDKLEIDAVDWYPSKLIRITDNYLGFNYKMDLSDYYSATNEVFLHVQFDVYQSNRKNKSTIHMVVKNDSTTYSWDSKVIRDFVKGKREWEKFSYYKYMPRLASENDYIHIFFTNNGEEVDIDNLKLSILVMGPK